MCSSCVQNVLIMCVKDVLVMYSVRPDVFRMCSLCVQDGLPESDVGPRPLLLQAVVGGHAEHAAVHIRHLLASDPPTPSTALAARWRSPSARSFLSSLRRTKWASRPAPSKAQPQQNSRAVCNNYTSVDLLDA